MTKRKKNIKKRKKKTAKKKAKSPKKKTSKAKKSKIRDIEKEYYPAAEQGIGIGKTRGKGTKLWKEPDEEQLDMDVGEKDQEVYSRTGREKLVEDDEIDAWEEGFMEGAEGKGKDATCAHCGEVISQSKKKTVEKLIRGKLYKFCSDKCAKGGKR